MKKFFSFRGRASRKEFWLFYVICLGVSIVSYIVDVIMIENYIYSYTFITSVIGLIYLYPMLATITRRLHDINKSGTYYFMMLIPFAGPIILLIALVQRSDEKANQYGEAVVKGGNNE